MKTLFIMESPRIVTVKSEVENLEYADSKEIDFELHVKVENLQSHILEGDWCIQNQLLYQCGKDAYSESKDDQLIKQECERCLYVFEDSNALYMHNLSHLQISLSDIKNHIITNGNINSEESLYQCEICDKILPYKQRLRHRKKIHKDGVFTCKFCKATFQHRRYLKTHLRYVHTPKVPKPDTPENMVTCEMCPAQFKNKILLQVHMKNCHTESAICAICNSTLKSKTYLMTHIRRVHYNDGKEHRCEICNKNFRSPRYLSIHKKNSHSKGKKKVSKKNRKTDDEYK